MFLDNRWLNHFSAIFQLPTWREIYVSVHIFDLFMLDLDRDNEHRLWENYWYEQNPAPYDAVGHWLSYDLDFGKINV